MNDHSRFKRDCPSDRLGIYREGDLVSHRAALELRTLPAAGQWQQLPLPSGGGFILKRKAAIQA